MAGIDLFRLDGRSAIVTGGTKGLGRSMAAALASAGAEVMICSRNAEEAGSEAKALAAEFGTPVMGRACDVSSEGQVSALVESTISEFGKVDILINNAGINIRAPIEELSLGQFQQVMEINVNGPWLCARAVIPHMKKQGWGRIINLSSTLGAVGVPGRTPYASSKGAVVMMTKVLALELARFGITVNAICPGPFLTPMNQGIAEEESTKKMIIGAVPLARWGEMHEIEGAAIYLSSDASSYVTGSSLFVDGGWTAH